MRKAMKVLAFSNMAPSYNTREVLGFLTGESKANKTYQVSYVDNQAIFEDSFPYYIRVNAKQWALLRKYWGSWSTLNTTWNVILSLPIDELESLIASATKTYLAP